MNAELAVLLVALTVCIATFSVLLYILCLLQSDSLQIGASVRPSRKPNHLPYHKERRTPDINELLADHTHPRACVVHRVLPNTGRFDVLQQHKARMYRLVECVESLETIKRRRTRATFENEDACSYSSHSCMQEHMSKAHEPSKSRTAFVHAAPISHTEATIIPLALEGAEACLRGNC